MKYFMVQHLFLCFVSRVMKNFSISAQNTPIMWTAPKLVWFILAQDPSSIQIWLKSIQVFFSLSNPADSLTNRQTTG